MLDVNFDYAQCIAVSERVAWRLDDVFSKETTIQFAQPHLPEALSHTQAAPHLNDASRLKLNQIRGNTYMNLFGFVEEYIIAQTVQHAEAEMYGDHTAVRALLRFGEEEVKHQELFKRYCSAFKRDFGVDCKILNQAADVARVIMSKTPAAVMMVTLHIELMTQLHYTSCIKDNQQLDPLVSKILKHHWVEESQHAKIDTLELDKLVTDVTPEIIDSCFSDYLDMTGALDGLLKQQAEMDLQTLQQAGGAPTNGSAKALVEQQHQSYRRVFIGSGMTHPGFVKVMQQISPKWTAEVAKQASRYA